MIIIFVKRIRSSVIKSYNQLESIALRAMNAGKLIHLLVFVCSFGEFLRPRDPNN